MLAVGSGGRAAGAGSFVLRQHDPAASSARADARMTAGAPFEVNSGHVADDGRT